MSVSFRSSSYNIASSAGTIAVNKPTGLALGDLMIAQFLYEYSYTPTPPSGFTLLTTARLNSLNMDIYYKFANATDVAASNFTFTVNYALDNVGASISAFYGASIPQPIYSFSKTEHTSSSSLSFSSISTLANSIICIMGGNEFNGTASGYSIATSNPSWTEDVDASQGGTGTYFTMASAHSSVRSVSTATGLGNITFSSSAYSGGVMFCIPPDQSINVSDSTSLSDNNLNDFIFTYTETLSVTDNLMGFLRTTWRNVVKNISSWINQEKSQ